MSWPDLVQQLRLDLLLRLIVAVILGGAIGFERELHGKPAGLRTNTLICVGAALFTQLSEDLSGFAGDPSRIAAQIVTGVGFLGAGTILRGRGTVVGLTSAATIWLVAAIGMAVGGGQIFEAVGATVLVVGVLSVMGRVEVYLQRRSEISRCSLEVTPDQDYVEHIMQIVQRAGARVEELESELKGDHLLVHVTMRGAKHSRDKAQLALLRSTGAYRMSVDKHLGGTDDDAVS